VSAPASAPGWDLSGHGQPVGPLDPSDPCLGGRQQGALGGDPDPASYLNRIECHFAAYVEFVICGSDHASQDELTQATRA
jgi:hypothetical protein